MEGETVESAQVTDLGHAWDLAHLEAVGRDAVRALETMRAQWNGERATIVRQMNQATNALERFQRQVVDALMEKAEQKGWCDEAEQFIEDELGLGELLEKEVDVEVSFRVTMQTRGRRVPEQDAVDEACRDYIRNQMDSCDWRVVDGEY